jgi:hypothetical protein
MKKNVLMGLLGAAMGLMAFSAQAGKCEITVTRTACPGKEALSYKKCDGKQSCTEVLDLPDAAACKKQATSECENKRFEITKSKVYNAKFDGTALKSDKGDANFCSSYPKRSEEYDQC